MKKLDSNIKYLINCINDADNDRLKMRNISNFYEKYTTGRYENDPKIIEKLILNRKSLKNERDISMYNILPFVLSDRNKLLLPEKLNDPVNYKIGNLPLDKDLERCNIFVYENEFR